MSRAGKFFILWTIVGGLVMALGWDAGSVARLPLPGLARQMGIVVMRMADALWITMAAWLVFRHESQAVGIKPAAIAFFAIALPAAQAEWFGATTGVLFGHYAYTGNFGWRIAGVLPFTIPLAWYLVVVGSARCLDGFKRLPRRLRPVAAGLLATLTDLNLEPVAIHTRNYWQWTDGPGGQIMAFPPATNFLTWFVLASFLSIAVRPPEEEEGTGGPKEVPAMLPRPDPPTVLGLMNLLFLFAHVGRWLR